MLGFVHGVATLSVWWLDSTASRGSVPLWPAPAAPVLPLAQDEEPRDGGQDLQREGGREGEGDHTTLQHYETLDSILRQCLFAACVLVGKVTHRSVFMPPLVLL